MADATSVSPRQRTRQLQANRRRKMARSAHAFVRGSTVQFYAWLDAQSKQTLPEGPAIWICGDCHAHNLGPVADRDGEVEFQVRDLDQSVIGNPAHDLVRLGLSLATAARGSDLPGLVTAGMLEQMLKGYAQAFGGRHARVEDAPVGIRRLLADADARRWKHLAAERIDGAGARIPRGKRYWNLRQAERTAIAALVESPALRELLVGPSPKAKTARVELLDAAYWVKGCSSLGLLRYAVLVDIVGAGRRHDRVSLVDIKEAATAAAPRYADTTMPRDNAQRIVEGARQLSPHLGERMLAARLLDKGVFVREMFPQDLKVDTARLSPDEAGGVARFLGAVVGRGHSRQLPRDDRRDWARELARNRLKSLETPSWLWRSVVDLVTLHEAAYLEHCRRYALVDRRR